MYIHRLIRAKVITHIRAHFMSSCTAISIKNLDLKWIQNKASFPTHATCWKLTAQNIVFLKCLAFYILLYVCYCKPLEYWGKYFHSDSIQLDRVRPRSEDSLNMIFRCAHWTLSGNHRTSTYFQYCLFLTDVSPSIWILTIQRGLDANLDPTKSGLLAWHADVDDCRWYDAFVAVVGVQSISG